MTPADIIQAEKVRAARVWHDLTFAPIKADTCDFESIILRHLLAARAEQIREMIQDPKRLTCNSAELLNFLNWDPVATVLEAAVKENDVTEVEVT